MLMDIWAEVGRFVCENYEAGLIVGLVIVSLSAIAQYLVNSSLEEDLIELTERIEALEEKCGIEKKEADDADISEKNLQEG